MTWQPIETAPKDRPVRADLGDGRVETARWRVPAWDDTGAFGYWMTESGKVTPSSWQELK